ncbi:MAG: NADH-quinone oxidoreductase subunit N [Melioribacteraceae bacterium]|nr:NADH-quinone oxidoreductase subunit N [Melioribacteraceae bacterium]MCF8353955.1 NADH-quinone oxidoreductase subunit N [Melioribacteraceae bacterium]MCF8393683.1 NADH-quinone oxidoreductase subunit N [Melioribacteraceae bacterium]MCF8419575.1 NADH-quinone oxidoreductase subunit N [Melioribacteraceae bacterium]
MPINSSEYLQILPFLILGLGIVISTLFEMYYKNSENFLPWFSAILFLVTGAIALTGLHDQTVLFGGMLAAGGKSAIFHFIFNLGAAIVVMSSVNYLNKYGANFGEYYILLQSSVLGMMMMSAARDIFMIFMGLELMSICFYVLAGINRKKASANEASMKYFLLGAFATGFIVYGIALIYGSAQTTSIDAIVNNFSALTDNVIFIVGFAILLIGFSFKIAAFPFHMWVPDVYQGSATTVTGLMSTTGKAAAFSVLIAIMTAIFSENIPNTFVDYFAALATLSMLFGSIVAIAQDNLKRMLAYSSISHAGYMLIGLSAGNESSVAGIIFYLAAYAFMNLGAFAVISVIEGENDSNTELNAYAGLNSKSPVMAFFMALFMFALAGIPPMAGFFGKYYVFIAAIEADLTWLAVVGVFSSAISVYFYLRVVVYMYFKESEYDFIIQKNNSGMFAVMVSGLLVLVFGILPDTLLTQILSVINY